MSNRQKSVCLARVLYRQSLRLLPRPFYAEYAEQMSLDFDDLLRDAAHEGGPLLVTKTFGRAVADVLLSAVREQLCRTPLEAGRDGASDGPEEAVAGGGEEARAILRGTDLSPVGWLPGTVVPAVYLAVGLGVGGVIASRVWSGEVGILLATHVLTVSWGYGAALAAGTHAIWVVVESAYRGDGRRGMEAFRRQAGGLAWTSLAMTAIAIVLGAVWANGQLGRAWGWDPREIGGLGVLLCAGLSVMALRLSPRAGPAAAIAASAAAVLAWLVPPLL